MTYQRVCNRCNGRVPHVEQELLTLPVHPRYLEGFVLPHFSVIPWLKIILKICLMLDKTELLLWDQHLYMVNRYEL